MVAKLQGLPELIAEPTLVRPWRLDDLGCVEQATADDQIPRGTTVPARFTADAGRDWIQRQWACYENGRGWSSAIVDSAAGQAVGCVVLLLRPATGVVGVGYWVVPAARGRGHASRAVGLMRDWALGPGGFDRVEAWVEPGNDPSVALLNGSGFHFEGRLRSYLSIGSGRSDALVFSSISADQ